MDPVAQELLASSELKAQLSQNARLMEGCNKAARRIINALKKGNKILICGNGGSAADAQHFAAELVVRFEKERRHLPALALNTNTSNLTATGNDYGYDKVFSTQVEAYGKRGDILIGITTSGNSPNIIEAVRTAKAMGLHTIILNGKGGGAMNEEKANINLIIAHNETKRVQEAHITIIHAWCGLIDKAFS